MSGQRKTKALLGRIVMAGIGLCGFAGTASAAAPTHTLVEPAWRAATHAVATMLESDSPRDVAMALRLVQDVGGAGFEDQLLDVAKDGESELAAVALSLVAQTSDPRALEQLEAAIASGDPALVSVATVWLPAYGARGLEAAKRLLEHPSPVVRHAVVGALAHFPPADAVRGVLADTGRHADARTARLAQRVLTAGL